MARILLHDDPNPNPVTGIVLLFYRSCILLPYESDKPRTDMPCEPTSLVPIRLRPDKPRTVLPCEPIRSRADMPTEPALAPYCHPNQQASHCTALRTDKPRIDTVHEPDKSLYRYACDTNYEQVCYCPSTNKHRTNTVTPITNRHVTALVPTSTVLIRLRTRQALCRYAYKPNNLLRRYACDPNTAR
jgi:hypothetical protein